jgi:hypothetical protein
MRTIESELQAYRYYWKTKLQADPTFESYADCLRTWHAEMVSWHQHWRIHAGTSKRSMSVRGGGLRTGRSDH